LLVPRVTACLVAEMFRSSPAVMQQARSSGVIYSKVVSEVGISPERCHWHIGITTPVPTQNRERLSSNAGSCEMDEAAYLPKLATQLACSCGSLIGPHSLRMRLARKLPLACTTAS
jgi:hypothetical protein